MGLVGQGCMADSSDGASPATDEESAQTDEHEAPADTEQAVSALNAAGQACGGYCRTGWVYINGGGTSCRGGEFWYYASLPNVTQDCRARIVDFCHNRGWSFGDAYWAYSPYQGYLCTGRS